MAQTDSLTGVSNRYYFDKQFKREKEQSIRFSQPLSLIIVDINGLKAVNDKIGHEAGDALLKEITALLIRNIDAFDSIYRVGGDEFVILLPNCPKDRLEQIVERFQKIQESSDSVFKFKDNPLPLHFSLGGACSTDVEHDKLKETADKRMYLDKEIFYNTHERYR